MVRFYELTFLSSKYHIKKHAPNFYRSHKFIFINDNNCQNPEVYCGNLVYSKKNIEPINGYSVKLEEEYVVVSKKGKEKKYRVNPNNFAVRIMLPIESQIDVMELVSFEYLKTDDHTEPKQATEDVLDDQKHIDHADELDTVTEPVLSDLGNKEDRVVVARTALLENPDELRASAEDIQPFIPDPLDDK